MQPTKMQTLVLWALLAKGGEGFAKDLKPALEAPDRKALLTAGLIGEEKRKRAIWLEVTDKGWAWAAEHLGDELSARSTAGTIVLRDWLTRLQAFMRASNISLAEIMAPAPTPEAAKPAPDPAALRERIRNAYLQVTGGNFNKRALLSQMRAALADVDRPTLDRALERLHREDGTTLMTLDNPREITATEKSAALDLAGEPMHLLWIRQ